MKRLVVCMVIATMLASMGAVMAQEGLEGEECWTDRVCMSGYFQFRFVDDDLRDESTNFDLRRGFFTIQGDLDSRTTGIITFARVGEAADPNIDLYNAFVDYRFADRYGVQAGQVPTWFGLEAWEGSSVRLPFERAKILEGGPGGWGFWYQGAADRGVWLRRTPEGNEPLAVLGIWNGQFRSDDANGDKNVSIDLKWDKPWGQFGASWFDGEFYNAATDMTQDRSAVDLYVRKHATPWGFQAEWVDGEMFGADRDGFYLQGMYDLQGDGENVVFARYEEFNASVDAANHAEFDAFAIGIRHKVYESSHITAQYSTGDWNRTGTVDDASSNEDEDLWGIQWQYSYN
ncbi:MAG: porin [Armatimonadota bacterium]